MAGALTGSARRAEVKALLVLAGPLILGNVGQAVINATDVVMLGRVGARTLAASALGFNLFILFLVFGLGVLTALSPMIAQARGRRTRLLRDVRGTVQQSILVALLLAAPALVVLWWTEPMLRLLGQEPALAADAARFVRVRMIGLPAIFVYIVLRGFAVALERPLWPLAIGLAAVLTNALFNALLIFGLAGLPRLGLVGAALGSTINDYLMLAAMTAVMLGDRRFRRHHLWSGLWRLDRDRFVQVLRIGLPIGLTLAFEMSVFNAAVILMGLLGPTALAAHAIAIQVASLTFMVPLGLAQAVTVRVGLAAGRGDRAGVGRAGWSGLLLGVGFMGAMALTMVALPGQLVDLFLAQDDPASGAVRALAVSLIGVAALFQVADGAQVVGQGMLRGLKDTGMPMFFAALGYWPLGLGAGAWLAFGHGLGAVGIWLGLAIGLTLVAGMLVARWRMRERIGLVPVRAAA